MLASKTPKNTGCVYEESGAGDPAAKAVFLNSARYGVFRPKTVNTESNPHDRTWHHDCLSVRFEVSRTFLYSGTLPPERATSAPSELRILLWLKNTILP